MTTLGTWKTWLLFRGLRVKYQWWVRFRLLVVASGWPLLTDRFDCRWIISLNKNLRSEYQDCKTTLTLLVNAKYLTIRLQTNSLPFSVRSELCTHGPYNLHFTNALEVNQRIKWYLKLHVPWSTWRGKSSNSAFPLWKWPMRKAMPTPTAGAKANTKMEMK